MCNQTQDLSNCNKLKTICIQKRLKQWFSNKGLRPFEGRQISKKGRQISKLRIFNHIAENEAILQGILRQRGSPDFLSTIVRVVSKKKFEFPWVKMTRFRDLISKAFVRLVNIAL